MDDKARFDQLIDKLLYHPDYISNEGELTLQLLATNQSILKNMRARLSGTQEASPSIIQLLDDMTLSLEAFFEALASCARTECILRGILAGGNLHHLSE